METQTDETLQAKALRVQAESVNVENLTQNGNIHTSEGFHVENFTLQQTLRTPLQLFKASASVTAGVLFTAGVVLFASRALDYIISLF